jgi:hypothetical protein
MVSHLVTSSPRQQFGWDTLPTGGLDFLSIITGVKQLISLRFVHELRAWIIRLRVITEIGIHYSQVKGKDSCFDH